MTPSDPVPIIVRTARPADAARVRTLLEGASLPTDGVPEALAELLVAEYGRRIVGAIGLEMHGATAGLLRSAIVDPEFRGIGVGDALVHTLLNDARERHVQVLVLLTTTAQDWFPRFGFVRTTRDAVPTDLHASAEFQGACPASAVVMRLDL